MAPEGVPREEKRPVGVSSGMPRTPATWRTVLLTCTLDAALPDEARNNGAVESDLPVVLANSVAQLCCALTTWTEQRAASEMAHAHSKDLVVPWLRQSLLVGSSSKCAAAHEKDTYWSVALDASISLNTHLEEVTSNRRG